LENITITASSTRMWGDVDNLTINWLYPFGAVDEQVEINVSDGEAWSVYIINVTVEESNDPPTISFPQGIVVALDAQGILNLTPYAYDRESPRESLVWAVMGQHQSVVLTITDGHILQIIPIATDEGEHAVELSLTDPDDNTVYANLTVKLVEETRHSPVIRRGDDAIPRLIKVDKGGAEELNLAL
jgi:hypothetical protein